ncbi:carboxypeptidase regulatory-like domain-containing protein [bacterium]|nr:carboxypeptidase regulatory-like domain-containing protein [bacterium]
MRNSRGLRRWVAASVMLACLCPTAHALRELAVGNRPVGNAGWPTGCELVADLPSRLGYSYWWGGGGRYDFSYRCANAAEFNEALELFAAIRTPALELAVHDGPGPQFGFGRRGEKEERPRVQWTFTVCQPEKWHRILNSPRRLGPGGRLGARRPVPPPRIDVYVGGGSPIQWKAVVVPDNVRVDDRRKAAPAGPAEGELHGEVYDMATGQIIPGAEVAVLQSTGRGGWERVAQAKADALGRVALLRIPAGRYRIEVRAAAFASRMHGYYDNAGRTRHEFVAELCPARSLSGTVTDGAGNPVRDVKVSAVSPLGIDGVSYPSPDLAPAITDADGRFEVRSLPRGYAQVRCRARSLHQVTSRFELHDVPAKDVRILMARCGTVRVTVLADKKKLEAGRVHVTIAAAGGQRIGAWGGSARVGPDGSCAFKNVPPGDYLVSTRSGIDPGKDDPDAAPVTVEEGGTIEVVIADQLPR